MKAFIVNPELASNYRPEDQVVLVGDPCAADIILVFGGDGAMLHAIDRLLSYDKPFVGINEGTRGFLMNNLRENGNDFDLSGVAFESLWLLDGVAEDVDGNTRTVTGFNDIWVERDGAQTLRMRISVDGEKQPGVVVGDGVLFSTPQGSTGYNLALRGKTIPPGVSVIQLTPMAAVINKTPMGSVILPDESEISVEFEGIEKRRGRLLYDGIHAGMSGVRRITIRKSKKTIRIGLLPKYSFLRKVFSWQFNA